MADYKTPPECEIPDLEHTSLMAELARVVRYSAAAVGGYLVAEGYASQEAVELVTGLIVTATPLVAGMILARANRRHVASVIQTLKASKDQEGKGD